MWILFAIETVIALIAVLILLRIFASWKNTPWYAYFLTGLGWFLGLSPVFLVPADVAQVIGQQEAERIALGYVWKSVFWICQSLTWIICPFMIDYVQSGGFTVGQRFKASLFLNVRFYVAIGTIGGILIIVLVAAFGWTFNDLAALGGGVGNLIGLSLLTLLLGFGLVDVPRRFWRLANYPLRLRMYQFEATLLQERVEAAVEERALAMQEVREAKASIPFNHILRPYLMEVIAKFDPETQQELERGVGRSRTESNGAAPPVVEAPSVSSRFVSSFRNLLGRATPPTGATATIDEPPTLQQPRVHSAYRDNTLAILAKYNRNPDGTPKTTGGPKPLPGRASAPPKIETPRRPDETVLDDWDEKRLIRLHARVIKAEYTMRRENLLFDHMCDKVFDLEDSIRASKDMSHVWRSTIHPPRTGRFADMLNHMSWWWHVWLKPIACRALAIIFGLLSLSILWCQIMLIFWTVPDLSIFGEIVWSGLSAPILQIITIIPPLYIVCTAASSLFQIRIWTFFELFNHQQSPPSSLIFSASYIARVAPPTAFTVLSMCRLILNPTTHTSSNITAFSDIIGDYKVISALDYWFPVIGAGVLCLLCILTLFSVGSRIMNFASRSLQCILCCAKCKTFVFEEGYHDINIEAGKQLLTQARSRKERAHGREASDTGALLSDGGDDEPDNVTSSFGVGRLFNSRRSGAAAYV